MENPNLYQFLIMLISTTPGTVVCLAGMTYFYLIFSKPEWNESLLNFVRKRVGLPPMTEIHDRITGLEKRLDLADLRRDIAYLIQYKPTAKEEITSLFREYESRGGNGRVKHIFEDWQNGVKYVMKISKEDSGTRTTAGEDTSVGTTNAILPDSSALIG